MAKSLKEFMALSKDELVSLGNMHGLSFHDGMGKGQMAKQLENSLASGWLEVNKDLMGGAIDSLHEDSNHHFGSSDMISDAAHVAQMISGAGFAGAFHAAMNGPSHQAEAVHEYLDRLGVEADSVWMHLPRNDANIPAQPFGMLNSYMRDTLTGHQDIMPEISGHYAGDIMSEYSTNLGGVEQSYNSLAQMYLDKSQYQNAADYNHDMARVSNRLQQAMGPMFHEVAYSAANGAKTSYMSILPEIGSQGIVGNSMYPRGALNASGLPMGAMGSGINSEYSLTASLSGRPGWSDESKAIHSEVSASLKSLAQVYRGESGLNARPHIVSDRDQIMDSASRYADLTDVRSGYNNLVRDLGDDPRYSGSNIRSVLENAFAYNEADSTSSFDPAAQARALGNKAPGNGFTADFGNPTNWNPAVHRREAKAIADLDAASSNFRDTVNNGSNPDDGIRFHSLEQGSDEWLNFRKQYDITGSTVGAYLGNSEYDRPWAAMIDKVGLQRGKNTQSEFTQRIFAKGHAAEEAGRATVSRMLGQDIQQVGAITNDNFPGYMYSPDGLIGDDALWEHKNPENAKAGFANLADGDHPDYLDQIQMGMMLSGRKRTLFSQTRGGEMQHEWVDYDPSWYGRNKSRLDSVQERLAAGRDWLEQNPGEANDRERISGARAAMTGGGIWKDVRQRSNRGYSATAGTDADEFLQGSARRDADFEPGTAVATISAGVGTGVATIPTGTGVATVANGTEVLGPGEASMAVAVKAGILAAQDENRNKRTGRVFEGEFSEVFPEDGGRGGGSGGYGGGGSGGSGVDDVGGESRSGGGAGVRRSGVGPSPMDAFLNGVQGGSVSSMGAGALRALSMAGPWGRAAAVGVGAVQIGNEVAEGMNDFYGESLDAGVTNPNEYSSQRQGMEMLGLNSQQAGRIAQTTHSAYNTLLNGDPSAAVNIVRGSRGLLTMSDIREAQGDPVALARTMQAKAAARGWSQERVAGAMQMAGLHGMARANDRTDYDFQQAQGVVESGRGDDTSEAAAQLRTLQGERARVLPGYNLPQAAMAHGGLFFEGAGDAMRNTRYGVNAASGAASSVYEFIAQEESGGNANARSSTSSAFGAMQTLAGTRRDPGFGVRPAKDDSPEEAARVGRDYYDAMVREFGGDARKANAAYTDGHATVKNAVREYGDDWLNHMPAQAKNRVQRYDEWAAGQSALTAGAGGFTRGGMAYGQTVVNVQLQATVNNKEAKATVSTPQGTSKTQQLNMNAGAQRTQ